MYLCPLNTHPGWGNPYSVSSVNVKSREVVYFDWNSHFNYQVLNPPSPSFFFENQELLRDLNLYRPAFSFNLESGLLAWFLEVKIVAYKFLGLNEKARLLFAGKGDSRERGC